MRKQGLTLLSTLLYFATYACPICEKQQPELLKGITHGAGPESNWDYLIIWSAIVIVVLTLFYSVKLIIRPGEKSNEHIKRLILHDN